MKHTKDYLYDLLPVVYRMRDGEQGERLRAYLQVVTEQAQVVEDDITQLYENWFIETCQEWVVPYIGDLIGYLPAHEAGEPGQNTTARGQERNRVLIPRREVAKTIRYRKRKGTLALLEVLANDIAGWPARAVEFFKLLGCTQAINHLRRGRGQTIDLRDGALLELLDGPFDPFAHTVDIHRINSTQRIGCYNLPSVGVFVWRLKSYSITRAPACHVDEEPGCYTFSALGNDVPLYTRPAPENDPTHIAEEINLPVPIRRRAFEERRVVDGHEQVFASPKYYGWQENIVSGRPEEAKSVAVWAPGWPHEDSPELIPAHRVVPADLTGWVYRPPRGKVAVDPQLGRIAFPEVHQPSQGVWVFYHYGFSMDLGGGEYARPLTQPLEHIMYRVRKNSSGPGLFPSIKDALVKWAEDAAAHAVIEIADSGVYDEKVSIQFGPGRHSLQLRAANNVRPHICLVAYETGRSDSLKIRGQSGNRFTLDGLLISGRGMTVEGNISSLVIRHATMVPGWSLESVHKLQSHARPSLTIQSPQACVIIEHSILGTIQVSPMPPKVPEANDREEEDVKQQMTDDEAAQARCRGMGRNVRLDPISVCVSDSILDATDTDLEAIGAPGCPVAHAVLVMRRCTVLGQVQVHAIELAENSIFGGRVTVARRQRGCMRFCFVEPGSRTPKWYRCQPELAEQLAADEICAQLKNASAAEIDAALEAARQQASSRVRPVFNSVRYGTPAYCQLAPACAEEITRGADDESEMGVFHDLYQPQRTSNLRARLEEYTPAGMDAGILFAS